MRRLAAALALLSVAAGPAPPAKPDTPAIGWVSRDTADLTVLDKVSAQSVPLTLKVGQRADNVSLSITLRNCVVRPPDMPADSAAYLDIIDSRPGAPGFHGWLFANEPAVSMFEHPIYDIRLVNCH